MQFLSAAFLITALAIVFDERAVDAQNVTSDQVSLEVNRTLTIVEGPITVEGPKQDTPPPPSGPVLVPAPIKVNQTNSPEFRPPSKPPIYVAPDKNFFHDVPKQYYNPAQKHQAPPLHRLYTKDQLKQLNSVYIKYPNARTTQRGNPYGVNYSKPPHRQPLIFSAPTGKTTVAKTVPTVPNAKYSIPVQTINGIRAEFVRPPHFASTTTTTTTRAPTTTRRVLRTKRIWPKRILEKINSTQSAKDTSEKHDNTINVTNADLVASPSRLRISYTDKPVTTTTPQATTRSYRPVTRTSKVKYTTPTSFVLEQNDWVPIVPSHYPNRKTSPTHIRRRRSPDVYFDHEPQESKQKNLLYLQSYGLLPVNHQESNVGASVHGKNMVFFRKKKRQQQQYALPSTFQQPYSYVNSAENRPKAIYNPAPAHAPASYVSPPGSFNSLQPDESLVDPNVVTKVKHHHHHHHHRYVKTVEKPVEVPVKVEVPKPYPVEKKVEVQVPVEKIKVVDRPYPVQVEKKVPYPVTVRVPQPIPVKVIEKEYVPKPFPVVHHVPVIKRVEVKVPHPVPVHVERKVPYPVQVPVPIEKQVPFPIPVEKQVPYPVPVKVYVPQPYPVEKRIPYPVRVREEVIRHIKVPILKPYPVKVPYPVPIRVEKRVPYPVRVEKKVPYPVEVYVPQKIHVEKKVPIYIPKPYPVEKKVPYPIKVPYPVKVPVKVPVEVPVQVPVYIHSPYQILNQQEATASSDSQFYNSQYGSGASESPYYNDGASESSYYGDEEADRIGRSGSDIRVTSSPLAAVTVHGNTGYNGAISRSDSDSTSAHPVVDTTTLSPANS